MPSGISIRTIPAADDAPLAIVDLSWADVGDSDGQSELLAANVGEIGLVAIDTEGETVWRNRAFPNVTSVAVSRPDDTGSWGIFVTGQQGTVLRINRFGNEESPQTVGQWPIGRLVAARFAGGKQARFLGLSGNAQGEPFAVGITGELKEAWNYPLPKGPHQRPIDTVTSSNLLPGRQGEWWLAAPDGSIHVISEDGDFHDSFFYGASAHRPGRGEAERTQRARSWRRRKEWRRGSSNSRLTHESTQTPPARPRRRW